MANDRKRTHKIIGIIAGTIILLFFSIEIRPVRIYNSLIFTTPGNTEIKLNILMNTLLPFDEEKMIKEIICEEQMINGVRENPVYEVNLYRSLIHYRNNWKYNSWICDESGVTICD